MDRQTATTSEPHHIGAATPATLAADRYDRVVRERQPRDLALGRARRHHATSGTLIHSRSAADLPSILVDVLLHAREEVLNAVSGEVWGHVARMRVVCGAMRDMVSAGVTVRGLVAPELLGECTTGRLVARAATDGAQLRIAQEAIPDLVVVDRQIAIVRAGYECPDEDVLIVRSRPIMHAITTLFRLAWANAQEYAHAEKRAVLPADELGTQIVRLLTSGQKDAAAARELGLSVRTYRRHVAVLMQSLDASSRFQAGVYAARLGLVGGSGQPG